MHCLGIFQETVGVKPGSSPCQEDLFFPYFEYETWSINFPCGQRLTQGMLNTDRKEINHVHVNSKPFIIDNGYDADTDVPTAAIKPKQRMAAP